MRNSKTTASIHTVGVLLSIAGGAFAATRYVDVNSASPTPPFTNWAFAATNIQAAIDAAVAGDEIVVTNGVYQTGGRAVGTSLLVNRVAVDKPLTLRSVNGPQFTVIQGYQVPAATNGSGGIRCVYLANGASLSGFTLTNGAAPVVDYNRSLSSGGGVWCESETAVVSNCVIVGNSALYGGGGAFGGTLDNCILADNSAYGSWWNNGDGGGAYGSTLNNCTLAGNVAQYGGGAFAARLINCTLSTNRATSYGGGVFGGVLNNCLLSGNSAVTGGGAFGGDKCFLDCGSVPVTLSNCTLIGNRASGGNYYGEGRGGGVNGGTLNNCTLTGNSAVSRGGGAAGGFFTPCILNNCIVYYNTPDNYSGCSLNYSCTTPLWDAGAGNIINEPRFLSLDGGDLRLQSDSPCINAANNAYAPGTTDLDGLPRIVGGTVDIGAYEFQLPASVISYAWLQQYGLPTDGSADYADSDVDGLNTWQEWRCLTDPTNALSALRLLSGSATSTNVTVTWQSVAGVNYFLERSTNLGAQPVFTTLATGIPGQPGTTTYTDSTALGRAPFFYRVGVLY